MVRERAADDVRGQSHPTSSTTLEGRFLSAYDIAKDARPNLSVKFLHALETHNGKPRDRLIVAVHEHEWVSGHCVRGCGENRETDQ